MMETLVSNKWYPEFSKPRKSYSSPFPTPQSILRRACGVEEYKFACETVTTEHIRAAVIMPLQTPFAQLLNEPWAMSYRTAHWRMILVSTVDPLRWIDLARTSGAWAWQKGNNMTVTYNWEPPVLDENGLKILPHGNSRK
jgi:hypothetical protein